MGSGAQKRCYYLIRKRCYRSENRAHVPLHVNFDTYRNLQRHRAVLNAIARHLVMAMPTPLNSNGAVTVCREQTAAVCTVRLLVGVHIMSDVELLTQGARLSFIYDQHDVRTVQEERAAGLQRRSAWRLAMALIDLMPLRTEQVRANSIGDYVATRSQRRLCLLRSRSTLLRVWCVVRDWPASLLEMTSGRRCCCVGDSDGRTVRHTASRNWFQDNFVPYSHASVSLHSVDASLRGDQ